MNIRKLVDSYVECNEFEIKYKNKKINIYYYDKISHFASDKIVIVKDNSEYIIIGEKLVIETMFEELVVISGYIKEIKIGNYDE